MTTANVENFAADLYGESMPEVSQHAIDAEQNNQKQKQADLEELRDKRGARFNPDIHALNADGTPKLTKGGFFSRKKGKDKGAPKPSIVNAPTIDTQVRNFRATGTAIAETIFTIGQIGWFS